VVSAGRNPGVEKLGAILDAAVLMDVSETCGSTGPVFSNIAATPDSSTLALFLAAWSFDDLEVGRFVAFVLSRLPDGDAVVEDAESISAEGN
jgi:hypothetical protein